MRWIWVAQLLLIATPATAGSLTPSSAETAALKALATKIPTARVLWVRGDKVFHASAANGFQAQAVTQGSIVEKNPRWSPDGSQVLTVRSDGVYVMKSDFTGAAKVVDGGHTASWTRDGKSITCVDLGGYKVLQYELATKKTTTIYDAQKSPYNGQKISQAAELRKGGRYLLVFRLTPAHVTEIVDLQLKKYIRNQEMERGDCSPAWAPDGSYTLTTARTGSRPVLKTDFSTSSGGGAVSASKYFVGLDTSEKFYIHGQRVSNDGAYVAFGGKIFTGSMEPAKREIYIWRLGDPDNNAVRISFDTAEDEAPDLYVSTGGALPSVTADAGPKLTDGGSDAETTPVDATGSDDVTPGSEANAGTDGGSGASALDPDSLRGGCAIGGTAISVGLLPMLLLLSLLGAAGRWFASR